MNKHSCRKNFYEQKFLSHKFITTNIFCSHKFCLEKNRSRKVLRSEINDQKSFCDEYFSSHGPRSRPL